MTILIRALRPFGPQAISLYAAIGPEGDKIAFETPGMKRMFLDDLNAAAARGGLGAASADLVLFGRAWGFSVAEITVPVRFWHGDADHIVPLSHARRLCELVRGRRDCTCGRGESHLGTLVVGDEALRTVVDLWR